MIPTVLVTGASSGIGKALCIECVARGWKVIGVARSHNKLLALESKLGKELFHPIVCDVSDTKAIQSASLELVEAGVTPTLFFLNAGLAGADCIEDSETLDLEKHNKILAVNYFGAMAWVEFWQKRCQDTGGATFYVTSSILAYLATPRAIGYSVSKIAIARAFEGLALTYAGTNLHFGVVYPGPVATKALVGNWLFMWTPERMALYMVRCALQKKKHCEPQFLYSLLVRIARCFPDKWKMALLRKFVK